MSPEVTVALAVAFYMLPAIVAAVRHHPNQNSIFILNALLGWTILGWIGALVWAVSFVEPRKRETPFEGVWEKLGIGGTTTTVKKSPQVGSADISPTERQ